MDGETGPDKHLKPSIWQSKPWWCQPWSILLTGLSVVVGSWWLAHSFWLSGLITGAVALWWWFFLILVPAAYRAETTQGNGG
jgi:hypothetical protein